ncbi:hypothetical protein [Flavobacterium sp.]|uniref:hypothetical protein n=1 Tax=Flavobacterium sp. TaxID=239 RepID=UPI0037520BDC
MKIGLVGEAPNDTQSIKNLLEKKYPKENFNFFFMLNNINGSMLDNDKITGLLRKEFEFEKPDLVILIRDLDSLYNDFNKRVERQKFFSKSNSVINRKGIRLLHIFEIEALILSDIQTFNSLYNTNIDNIENVSTIIEPKEFLKNHTKKYTESDNPDIFKLLDFEKTLNCLYFKNFIKKFDKLISF